MAVANRKALLWRRECHTPVTWFHFLSKFESELTSTLRLGQPSKSGEANIPSMSATAADFSNDAPRPAFMLAMNEKDLRPQHPLAAG